MPGRISGERTTPYKDAAIIVGRVLDLEWNYLNSLLGVTLLNLPEFQVPDA